MFPKVSSVATLVAVVSVLVSATYAKHILVSEVRLKNLLSPDEFMLEIGRLLRSPRFDNQPIHYLARVKDKNAKVILGKYSANDLLALNVASKKDLNEEEFRRRKELCSNFELKPEERKFVNEIADKLRIKREEKVSAGEVDSGVWGRQDPNFYSLEERIIFMKNNLLWHCGTALRNFERLYLDNVEDGIMAKFSKKDRANLKKLGEIGVAFDLNQKVNGLRYPDDATRAGDLKRFLEERYKEDMDKIRETCNKLRDLIRAAPQKPRLLSSPKNQLNTCNEYLPN